MLWWLFGQSVLHSPATVMAVWQWQAQAGGHRCFPALPVEFRASSLSPEVSHWPHVCVLSGQGGSAISPLSSVALEKETLPEWEVLGVW